MNQASETAGSGPAPSASQSRFYIDVIRAHATVLIVLLHVSVAYIYQSDISALSWWVANAFHAFSRSAVPLFILISGALLLQPRRPESIGQFLRKRTLRILPPLAIWSIIYLVYMGWSGQSDAQPLQALYSLIGQPAYGHLWFLYMILGLYLMTPMLRIYVTHASRGNLLYGLILWFIFAQVVPLIQKGIDFEFYLKNFYSLAGFLGLFIGGYYLDQLTPSPKLRRWGLSLYGGGFLLLLVLTYAVKLSHGGEVQGFIYEVDSPVSLMMAVGNFLVLRLLPYEQLNQSWPWFKSLVIGLSSTSFTIYLLHMLLVNLMFAGTFKLHFNPAIATPLWNIPLQTLLTLMLCFGFTIVVRKLPLGRWLAP